MMVPGTTWRVTAAGPFGHLAFDVDITRTEAGVGAVVRYGDQRIEARGLQLSPDGEGYRVRWSQHLLTPLPVRVTVDAVTRGERLVGTAKVGLLSTFHLEGHRTS
jgi:hypothetical protein